MKTQYSVGIRNGFAVLFLAMVSIIVSCKDNDNTVTPIEEPKVLDLIQSNSNLETLAALLEGTSLSQTLSGSGSVTIFAPNDEAFANLPQGYMEGLSAQQKLDILKYHVYSGNYALINEIKREAIISLHGDPLFMEVGQPYGDLLNGQAKFVSKNIEALNGMIHIVDAVLIPDQFGSLADNIYKRFDYRLMYERMVHTGMLGTLEEAGHRTLLASRNSTLDIEDFLNTTFTEEQWQEIMKHHILDTDITGFGPGTRTALATMAGDSVYLEVLESGTYKFNNFEVPLNLLKSSNGTILFEDGFALPDKHLGILSLMDKRFYFNTIRSAMAVAKMTGRLYNSLNNADEEFTIFALKNNATGLNNLPTDEQGLANILKYHVLLEKVTAEQLQHNQTYSTWQGEQLTITKNGDTITINGEATITMSDLVGTNGVVHVIDRVIMPPSM